MNSGRRFARGCLLSAAMIAAGSAILFAHHGTGPYYDNTRSVETVGTITRLVFRNPHSELFLVAPSADRRASVDWQIELGPAAQLTRMGLTPDVLKPGSKIRAVGQPSRVAGAHALCCVTLTRIDGTPLLDSR